MGKWPSLVSLLGRLRGRRASCVGTLNVRPMNYKHLGKHFDIHGGGSDLIFPHHENEVAQSCCAFDTPYVNYWMHAGMVQVDQIKMSKSLGNFFTLRDVLNQYDSETLRYFLMSAHYVVN